MVIGLHPVPCGGGPESCSCRLPRQPRRRESIIPRNAVQRHTVITLFFDSSAPSLALGWPLNAGSHVATRSGAVPKDRSRAFAPRLFAVEDLGDLVVRIGLHDARLVAGALDGGHDDDPLAFADDRLDAICRTPVAPRVLGHSAGY
jgi:hypothetical protein